jgi:hypothetical protein
MNRKNAICVSFMFLIQVLPGILSSGYAAPSVSDLTIVSGHRGLALSISSDCAALATVEKITAPR